MKIEGFFPDLLIKVLKRERKINGIFSFWGTSLFADLSGFTKISEYFASFGREGSEELTRVLNDFFSKFYGSLKKYDGDILRFAGDAVTTFFEGKDSYKRALRFSEELLRIIENFEDYKTKFGNITLRLKGGISSGRGILVILGKEKKDYVFTGEAVNGAVEAEKEAKPNEILSSPKRENEISEKNFDIENALNKDIFKYFLNPYLKEVVEKKEEKMVNGHRKVVVIFIRLGRELSFEKFILEIIEEVIELIEKYSGYLNKIDFSDKGNLLMVLFGAPISMGEEIERALEFLKDLKKISMEKNVTVKVGVNYDNVYCGIVGSEERFEYTVMGDGVNTAARLMEIAPENEIIFSKNLEEKAPEFYIFEKLAPVKVKGKEKAVEISILKGKRGEVFEIKELFGRKKELEELNNLFEKFNEERAFISFISGPAGIGKSHFLNYFFNYHKLREKNLIYFRCNAFTSSIALFPFKELLIKILKKYYGEKIEEKILKILEKEIYKAILLEFLELKEKKEIEIPPEVYKNLLYKFIIMVLDDLIKNENIYFFIDNAHFLDSESIEFISFSLKILEKKGFYIFISGRENKFKDLNIFDYFIELKPFYEKEAKEFILNYLKVKEIPEKAFKEILNITGGNAQFIIEVLKFMLKSGYLERSEEFPEILILNETVPVQIPETLEGIALKEFDLLSLEEKKVLQIFSIVGENIPFDIVDKLKINENILNKILKDGLFLGINTKENRYFFIKQTYKDAIYESLEFSFKRKLHKIIGNIFEKYYKKDENLLSYHFYNARDKKGIYYLETLYEKLKKVFSLKECYKVLQNLIELKKYYKKDIKKDLIEIAKICLSIGMVKEAEKIIRENEKIFRGKYKSKSFLVLSEALRMQGLFNEAENYLMNAIKSSKEKFDKFSSYFIIARFYSFLGIYEKAIKYYKKALDMKEFESNPEYHSSKAYHYYILYETEKRRDAFNIFKEEIKWFKRKNYIGEYLIFLNNLSNFYVYEGDFYGALKNYKICLKDIFNYSFINLDLIINLFLNISFLSIYLGNFDFAKENIYKAISYSKKFNSILASKAISYLAYFNFSVGNYIEVKNNLEEGINLSKKSNFPYDEFLQFGMDFSFEIGDLDYFKKFLMEYKDIIEKENLLFLKPTLLNYEAEYSILSGEAENYIKKEEENAKISFEEKNFIEAFRALRFLYLLKKEKKYLKEMENIFKNFEHFSYKIEYLIFKYLEEKNKKVKDLIQKLLKKCPDNVLKLKGYISLGDKKKEKVIYEKIERNIPLEFKESFNKLYSLKFFLKM